MPYFIDGNNCVRKGTKEDPGELVKCHEDHAAALAHLQALYANVEDAGKSVSIEMDGVTIEVKGGPSSGWHKPPRGTHDAEHAPNFAGGPGADRTYGTESDEPPEGAKRCKCTKCGAIIVLPKGKQCEDIKCPSCGSGTRQETPREDKPAEGEGGRNPKPGREKSADDDDEEPCLMCEEERAVHGEGSMLGEVTAVMDTGETKGGAECKCPHCGKDIPCTAKACPYCKKSIDKVERNEEDKEVEESEKAEWSSASVNDLPDSCFLYVESGEKDDEGKTTPRSKRHLPYKNASGEVDLPHLRNAISRLGQPATGKGWMSEDLRKRLLSKAQGILKKHGGGSSEEKAFTIYKSTDGTWRWMTLSNWSVVDKEREVVSEQAYRDAIAYAQKSGDWGQLDLVHVNGTDVGDCDQLFILKSGDDPAKFGAGGTWYDTAKAAKAREAIQAEPEHWGVSLKFRFNPQRFVRGIYTGDIQVLKHSILPQDMAASYGTAIAVAQGGNQMSKAMDEKAAEALRKLGHTEDEIAELAEKQKALPEEENVVEKEDTTQEAPERSTIWKKLGEMLGIREDTPVAASEPDEARKADEVGDPVGTVEPAEIEKAEGDPQEAEKEAEKEASAPENAGVLIQALGETVAKSIGEMVRQELDVRDKRIAALEAQIRGLGESVEEKVEQRLRDLPQVVKVAASQVAATAVTDDKPKGLTFGRPPDEAEKFASSLVADIQRVVQDKMAGAQFEV